MRYHVDTRAKLELVQIALDQRHGLRDAIGLPTPREQMVYRPDFGLLPASVALGPAHNCYDLPSTHWPLIEADDGMVALEIPDEIATVADALGKTVSGVAIPRANQLAQETELPARLRAAVQTRRTTPRAQATRAR